MNTALLRRIGECLIILASVIVLIACNNDNKQANQTAQAFLQAYYVDLDFDKAKSLCSDVSRQAIEEQAMMIGLNPYAKDEVPNIVVHKTEVNSDNPATATCTYSCNRVERVLPLRQFNNIWLVDLGGKTVETASLGGDFITLSQDKDGANGFASATSGEVKYKKRRQGNK